MEKILPEKSPFTRVAHIGVVVRDMDKAIAYYQSLGIGPFQPLDVKSIERKVYGKIAPDVQNLSMVAQMGPIQFELIQPVSGESVQKEFLEKCGEGINHLGFIVDNLDKEVTKLIKKGFKVISSGKFKGGGGFAYFNTDKIGGVIMELVQWLPR